MSAQPETTPDRDARIAELEALLADANAMLAMRELLIEKLKIQIARLKRMSFGASSEKLAQLELALEELETAEAVAVEPQPVPSADKVPPVRALPEHLPREEVCTSLSPVFAPARRAAARCARSRPTRTRCSTSCR